jgi:hypothetical protein
MCDCVMNITRCHLCYQRNVIGAGITGGTNPTHIIKLGYFLSDCGNVNVSSDWVRKLNSYKFMHSLHAYSITRFTGKHKG